MEILIHTKHERTNMNNNLMPALTSISKLPINTFQIDTKNDIIKLNFESINDDSQVSEIIFNDVVSFYYLDHDDATDQNESPSLNTIMYCGNSTPDYINIPEEDDVAVSIPNFIIELNDSNMFIEANSIVIDQKKYIV